MVALVRHPLTRNGSGVMVSAPVRQLGGPGRAVIFILKVGGTILLGGLGGLGAPLPIEHFDHF